MKKQPPSRTTCSERQAATVGPHRNGKDGMDKPIAERMTLAIPEDLRAALTEMARERAVSEAELALKAIHRFVQANAEPIPRFARRLGPMVDR